MYCKDLFLQTSLLSSFMFLLTDIPVLPSLCHTVASNAFFILHFDENKKNFNNKIGKLQIVFFFHPNRNISRMKNCSIKQIISFFPPINKNHDKRIVSLTQLHFDMQRDFSKFYIYRKVNACGS